MKKVILTGLIYLLTPIALYLLLAVIGCIWQPFYQTIHSEPFNIIYFVFIGWWVGIPVAAEYWEN